MESSPSGSLHRARHRGPPLIFVAGVCVLLFLAAVVLTAVLTGGQHIPSPFAPAEASARYFTEQAHAARLAAFFHFGSAIPLGIFVASTTSRVQFLGMKGVAGLHIALFGGFAAAIFLALSAFGQWVLAHTSGALPIGTIHALTLLQFAAGGPGYVVPFGLFIAGISLTAGIQGFAPRWLMFAGLAIAAASELSSLVLVLPPAAILLPIARFTGFVWMLCIALLLPKSRGAAAKRGAAAAAAASVHDAVQAEQWQS